MNDPPANDGREGKRRRQAPGQDEVLDADVRVSPSIYDTDVAERSSDSNEKTDEQATKLPSDSSKAAAKNAIKESPASITIEQSYRTDFLSRRIPRGYDSVGEAETALTELLESVALREESDKDGGEDEAIRKHHFQRSQREAFNARTVNFEPDTAILGGYGDLVKDAKKLNGQLNQLHMTLLERQAEILQLRMSTVTELMDFQSSTSSIVNATTAPDAQSESSRHTPTSEAESVEEEDPLVQFLPLTTTTTTTTTSGRQARSIQSMRRLSLSMHTIDEEGTTQEDSSESMTTPQGSSSDGSSPPADRWDPIAQNSAFSNVPSGRMHQPIRSSSFPAGSPSLLQSRQERSKKLLESRANRSKDDMSLPTSLLVPLSVGSLERAPPMLSVQRALDKVLGTTDDEKPPSKDENEKIRRDRPTI